MASSALAHDAPPQERRRLLGNVLDIMVGSMLYAVIKIMQAGIMLGVSFPGKAACPGFLGNRILYQGRNSVFPLDLLVVSIVFLCVCFCNEFNGCVFNGGARWQLCGHIWRCCGQAVLIFSEFAWP